MNAIRHPGIIDIFGAKVLPDGRPCLVRELLDFGVARRDGLDEPLTGPQMTVGSLGPEHMEGRVGLCRLAAREGH